MRLRFLRKKHEVNDVWSYFFAPESPLTWTAGQSIRLEIPRQTWGVDERRFTISSAPHEQHIRITTRLSESNFKQALHKLKSGDEIQGQTIDGDFVWKDSQQPKLFIAAGIGITPFRSIIAERINQSQPLHTTLVYTGSDKPFVFQNELQKWQAQDPTFNVHFAQKRFDIATNSTLAPLWHKSLLYISGPEAMVRAITNSLLELGVKEKQVITDQFTGYKA